MPRIFISDSTAGGTHGATIKAAILANHSGLVDADITLQLYASYSLANVLTDMATANSGGYEVFMHCTTLSPSLNAQAKTYWQSNRSMRVIVPLGNNSHVPVVYSPDERSAMVTCGASDGAANETGYGNALWFFDDDNDGNPAVDASSYSTGVIAGKLLYIKDQRGCGWWEAIYAAEQTASGGGVATLNDGYGKIDVAGAIAWSGVVPYDPFLPIGTVGVLSGSNAGSVGTLTAEAVTNAEVYYLERNTGSGWEVIDVHGSSLVFTIGLEANVETSFRYRAGNGGGESEYSNTIILEWVDAMALKRQLIVDAIKTKMQLINGASPYYLDCTGKVFVHRDNPLESAENKELPGINITDGDENPDVMLLNGASNIWWQNLDVAIQLVCKGSTGDVDLRKGLVDIKHAIGLDLTLGGLAIDTVWVSTTVNKDQMEAKIFSGVVNVRVQYQTVQWEEE